MNQRIKYIILFLLLSFVTYLSTKLWDLTVSMGVLNPLSIALTFALILFTVLTFIKIFKPESSYVQMIGDLFTGQFWS
jgi:hypothetical protein